MSNDVSGLGNVLINLTHCHSGGSGLTDSVHRPVSEMVSIGGTVQTGGTDRAVHFLIITGLRDKARGEMV